MTKKRYWTQFGYTSQEAMWGWKTEYRAGVRTAPWSSQTKYYMENIVKCSSLFLEEDSLFWDEKKLKCTLFVQYVVASMARIHYLGHYFDYEVQNKETTAIGD